MPVALERKLKKEANKKGIKDKDAYVYGTLRKTGWKPNREKKMEAISSSLDSIIRFDDDNKNNLLPSAGTALTGAGLAGAGLYATGAMAPKSYGGAGLGARSTIAKAGRDISQIGEGGGARIGKTLIKGGDALGSVAGKVWNAAKGIFMESREEPIQFGSEIMNPWQGTSGHESKIDQLEFPAGLSPAAVLKFPFPKLMAYLNRRNLLQQTFGWKHQRLIQLKAKLNEINA